MSEMKQKCDKCGRMVGATVHGVLAGHRIGRSRPGRVKPECMGAVYALRVNAVDLPKDEFRKKMKEAREISGRIRAAPVPTCRRERKRVKGLLDQLAGIAKPDGRADVKG